MRAPTPWKLVREFTRIYLSLSVSWQGNCKHFFTEREALIISNSSSIHKSSDPVTKINNPMKVFRSLSVFTYLQDSVTLRKRRLVHPTIWVGKGRGGLTDSTVTKITRETVLLEKLLTGIALVIAIALFTNSPAASQGTTVLELNGQGWEGLAWD